MWLPEFQIVEVVSWAIGRWERREVTLTMVPAR